MRRHPVLIALLVVAVVLAAGGGYLWWDSRQTHKVSVTGAVDRFRSAQPTASASPVALAGPAPGVYVYATKGSERISAGVTHTYPEQTTLTVKQAGCGLQLRWDALAERWMEWELCPAPAGGWRLDRITDLHKFLYLADRQELDCGDDAVLRADATFTCRTGTVEQGWRVTDVGVEPQAVGGSTVQARHVRAVSHNTGPSANDGTVDLWLHPDTGLPVRVVVRNHGGQHVLGQDITYDESATFVLTSLTPRR